MQPRWLCIAANALVLLSLADGTLSLVDEALRAATGVTALVGIRSALAGLVFLGMGIALPALALTPRLPLVAFLPLVLGTLWLSFGAAPLGLWLESPATLGIVAASLQVAFALGALGAIRHRNRGRRWLFDADSPEAPAFAWSRSLGFAGCALFAGLPAAGFYVALLFVTLLQQATAGFVSFDFGGVHLADRRYARGEQEIRLVGMMHIGEQDAYRELAASFATESTVVLAEGLTDRDALLGGTLEYGTAAEALGLAPQQDLRAYLVVDDDPSAPAPEWPEIRHADVDASAFSPETLAWLRWAGTIWSAPDVGTALRRILAYAGETRPEQIEAFQHDVLDLRNARLCDAIDEALTDDYRRVIVPWGALHLPAIEQAVHERGFEETSRARHLLIAWRTLAAAL